MHFTQTNNETDIAFQQRIFSGIQQGGAGKYYITIPNMRCGRKGQFSSNNSILEISEKEITWPFTRPLSYLKEVIDYCCNH